MNHTSAVRCSYCVLDVRQFLTFRAKRLPWPKCMATNSTSTVVLIDYDIDMTFAFNFCFSASVFQWLLNCANRKINYAKKECEEKKLTVVVQFYTFLWANFQENCAEPPWQNGNRFSLIVKKTLTNCRVKFIFIGIFFLHLSLSLCRLTNSIYHRLSAWFDQVNKRKWHFLCTGGYYYWNETKWPTNQRNVNLFHNSCNLIYPNTSTSQIETNWT